MARRTPPRKVRYFEPVAPRLARNTVIESTFEVGRRYRCTMRVDCGRLDPGVVIRPELGEWHPRMPDRLDEQELADWRAGRDAVYSWPKRSPTPRPMAISSRPTGEPVARNAARRRRPRGRSWLRSAVCFLVPKTPPSSTKLTRRNRPQRKCSSQKIMRS